MFSIGPWVIDKPGILAPMAGITDLPFRQLCRYHGAGLAVSEMLHADKRLWNTRKSQLRLTNAEDQAPRSVQLAGNDPRTLALAAKANVEMGADIIDINMGCPAKKVCRKAAGSALLKDEKLVAEILSTVVASVEVPVTLKIRTGWDSEHRNGVTIAKIAEDSGVAALAVHGRTRACAFKGNVEYDTIADIVSNVSMPVFANGDIVTPEQAKLVFKHTGAAAVMIGRGSQGNPWIFRELNHYLETGRKATPPSLKEICDTAIEHIQAMHQFYGEIMGTRIARKHILWYLNTQAKLSSNKLTNESSLDNKEQGEETHWQQPKAVGSANPSQAFPEQARFRKEFQQEFNRIESANEQYGYIRAYFEKLSTIEEKAA